MNLFLHGVEPHIHLGNTIREPDRDDFTVDTSNKLDITWLKDESLEDRDELPEPQDLAREAITELEAVVGDLREIVALVEKDEGVEK
ncbi:MAG TPA: hypothetical protein P5534_03645 [Candidatus Paceibacterota bacterium]|nr:hypothetical protein [Candidatus Paceibacterota bacterium]HRZ58240.1 hypothetical protein [Candidatus Paceibacterota bacterium]